MIFHHIPVLFQAVINLIAGHGPQQIIDATVGGGGHAKGLLERLPDAQLLGIDRDDTAIAASIGWNHADAVLMDIGVSSPQIDNSERGFSFRMDGPLDMRMNRDDTMTAAILLNTASQEELETIIREYGEDHKARFIAHAIVKQREKKPFETTAELNQLLEKIVGFKGQHGLPPATRTFQALRIAVNHELDELSNALKSALELLSPHGILAVITFHSLEDRIVKRFFQYEAATCVCPPKMPICTCGKKQTIEILTRKPITADEQELKSNPRAACAKLRAAMKLDIH